MPGEVTVTAFSAVAAPAASVVDVRMSGAAVVVVDDESSLDPQALTASARAAVAPRAATRARRRDRAGRADGWCDMVGLLGRQLRPAGEGFDPP